VGRAEELIVSGERRVGALFQAVRARRVAAAELADIEGAHLFFTNVNTPQDYAGARRALVNDE
jgi:molybdopterin-guanine dinucleotide biosynthesis protein A